MSPCTRYPNHLSHGNSFSNGEQNPPLFATWWSFLLLCPLRSCCKLQGCFKMLPLKGTPTKINRPERQLPLSSADTTFRPGGAALSGGTERCPAGSQAGEMVSPSVFLHPQLLPCHSWWPNAANEHPLSGDCPSQELKKLNFSGGSSCLVMRTGYF